MEAIRRGDDDIDEEKRMRMRIRSDLRLRDYIIPEILMKRRE